MTNRPPLEHDFDATLSVWKQYVSVRFSLLGLIPLASAIGVTVTADSLSAGSVLLSVLAIVSIYGIALYDIRNSILHDAAVHRLKELENQLVRPKLTHTIADGGGGLFNERPRPAVRLGGLTAQHDFALRIVYSASIAAWAGLAIAALVEVGGTTPVGGDWGLAAVGAVGAFVLSHSLFKAADRDASRIRSQMRA